MTEMKDVESTDSQDLSHIVSHGIDYTSDLIVLLPTRGRRDNVIRCATSFSETSVRAQLLLITDDDDNSYDGLSYPGVTIPRMTLSGKLNRVAMELADSFKALMFTADDHVFRTSSWDEVMMSKLDDMGGTGILYPDNSRRADVPECWMVSSDIVMAL